jgi:hypothetical protein
MARRLIFLIVLSPLLLYSQDSTKYLIGEAGIDFFSSDGLMNSRIRKAESSSFQDLTSSDGVSDYFTRAYAGIKVEFRMKDNMIGVLTGIKYSRNTSQLTRAGYPGYFYFLHRQTGTTTDYLRIRMLEQVSSYIGIPVEVKFFAYGERRVRLFFSAGLDINYNVHNKNNIQFEDPAMDKYADEISAIIGTAGDWHTTFYARAGLTFGKKDPSCSLALTLPASVSSSVSTLINPGYGGGINLQLQKRF